MLTFISLSFSHRRAKYPARNPVLCIRSASVYQFRINEMLGETAVGDERDEANAEFESSIRQTLV